MKMMCVLTEQIWAECSDINGPHFLVSPEGGCQFVDDTESHEPTPHIYSELVVVVQGAAFTKHQRQTISALQNLYDKY